MKTQNDCQNCALAKWQRTKTGGLHPSGDGRCIWTPPEIKIPEAFIWLYTGKKPFGPQHISRRHPHAGCAAWQPIMSEPGEELAKQAEKTLDAKTK